jgi:hypothetical protein
LPVPLFAPVMTTSRPDWSGTEYMTSPPPGFYKTIGLLCLRK